ncbi:MAG: hypothetical protein K6E47_13195 [Lachnospiraceae bacterium]|nr:hypothetical protein [Lachnospiraceae bacterium]
MSDEGWNFIRVVLASKAFDYINCKTEDKEVIQFINEFLDIFDSYVQNNEINDLEKGKEMFSELLDFVSREGRDSKNRLLYNAIKTELDKINNPEGYYSDTVFWDYVLRFQSIKFNYDKSSVIEVKENL